MHALVRVPKKHDALVRVPVMICSLRTVGQKVDFIDPQVSRSRAV